VLLTVLTDPHEIRAIYELVFAKSRRALTKSSLVSPFGQNTQWAPSFEISRPLFVVEEHHLGVVDSESGFDLPEMMRFAAVPPSVSCADIPHT
jgi:hypothetical protein